MFFKNEKKNIWIKLDMFFFAVARVGYKTILSYH